MRTLLALFILASMGCQSQQSKNTIDKTAIPLIETFFKNVQSKDPTNALSQLLATNPYINLEDSSTLYLKNNFILLNETSGQYTSWRLLKKRSIENDIAVYSCLAKYERKFYRFIFMFYNNGSTVRLYKFLYDDNIDIELEGSLKFYTE